MLIRRNTSERQREAARRNGARSTGPRTVQSKSHSSANARQHGLYSRVHVFSVREAEQFQALREYYVATLRPAGPLEESRVARLAFAAFQQGRAQALETALFNEALESQCGDTQSPERQLATAFRELSDSGPLASLFRLQAHYGRLCAQAWRRSLDLRARKQNFAETNPATFR